MTKRETVAALLGKLNGTFEQWNDGDADVENSLFIDLYDTLRALAEFALDLDERLSEWTHRLTELVASLSDEADAQPEAQPRCFGCGGDLKNGGVHAGWCNKCLDNEAAQPTRRLRNWYCIGDDHIWKVDAISGEWIVDKVGPVGSPEVERCYEPDGADTDSTAVAAPDGARQPCEIVFRPIQVGETSTEHVNQIEVTCPFCFEKHPVIATVIEPFRKRDDAQEDGE